MAVGAGKPKKRGAVRTNVVLDEALVRKAMELSGIKTKREVIEEALRRFVQLHEQDRVWELFGAIEWEGDLNEMRKSRSFVDADR
jgi:Arc/MetJ family transcription regulator